MQIFNYFITFFFVKKKKAEFSRVMSLKDGTKKMSKSDPSDSSRINLIDTPE